MFNLLEVFIVLFSFIRSLATKCMSVNIDSCINRPFIDLNPVEFKYYPFMINLDKCNGSCNVIDDLSTEIHFPTKTKSVNVKVFNIIIRINEAKTLAKHNFCDCKWNFDCTTCNLNQKWNNETCQCECKNYYTCKKDYSWNLSLCICENDKSI